MRRPEPHYGIDGKLLNQAEIQAWDASRSEAEQMAKDRERGLTPHDVERMVNGMLQLEFDKLRISGGQDIAVKGRGREWEVSFKAKTELGPRLGGVAGPPGPSASMEHPLKIVGVTDTTYKVLAGYVGGHSLAEFASGVIAATKYVCVEVTEAYDSATGIWSSSAAAFAQGAAYSTATATKLVVPIGIVNFSGGVITTITQVVSGNQWVARTGIAWSNVVDANGLV